MDNEDKLLLNDYKVIQHNTRIRKNKTKFTSGGVAFLIHNRVFTEYIVKSNSSNGAEILSVLLEDKISKQKYHLTVCYFSPENLLYGREPENFYNKLENIIYENTTSCDSVLIMGDLNSRIVSENDFVAGIDLFSKCRKFANWQLADCCRHIKCNHQGPKTEFSTGV